MAHLTLKVSGGLILAIVAVLAFLLVNRAEELPGTPTSAQAESARPQALPTATPIRLWPTPLSASDMDFLREFAVGYVNFDRADHGLPPVVLGTNPAAQLHAEDMLEHQYLGHWWVDGRKPYMVYTQTGGTSYAFENAASMGWTDDEWDSAECDEVGVACKIVGPEDAILALEYRMVYDDAHADWRHRDNILGESHRAVNIGVGWNGRRVTFVLHFEGGSVEADGPPVLDARGVLSLSLTKREPGDFIWGSIAIYYDPPPVSKTPAEIEALKNTEGFHSYCLGGGFTANCPDSYAVEVLKPSADGSPYPDLPPNVVVASSWTETATPTGGRFSFTAEVGPLMREPGVYTVVARRDSSLEVLVALSLTVAASGAVTAPDANNAPEFAAATDTRSVAENTAAGEDIGAPVEATDADNDTLTYTLGGADMASFDIDVATGQLMTKAALDYEAKASYEVEVTADDGTDIATVTVTITVTDLAEGSELSPYDTDNSGKIEGSEVIQAVRDYFDGDITGPEVIEVVKLYFAGRSN